MTRDALDALDALDRFAGWCVQATGFWRWRWDLSFLATIYQGAADLGLEAVQQWSRPVFDAFVAGAWFLYWTDDTLFWVAKPRVHRDPTPNTRRLHNDHGPALESDVEPLYFWRGVLVPPYVIEHPEQITVQAIDEERNAEVRRVLLERFGITRYLLESGTQPVHEDGFGTLYRRPLTGDEDLVMVRVLKQHAGAGRIAARVLPAVQT